MNILNIRFELTNPWSRQDFFKNLGCISKRLTKYKSCELEHTFYSGMLLDADIRWTRKQDHAGFEITVGVFGYGVHFMFYDVRHWDYETDKWVVYG